MVIWSFFIVDWDKSLAWTLLFEVTLFVRDLSCLKQDFNHCLESEPKLQSNLMLTVSRPFLYRFSKLSQFFLMPLYLRYTGHFNALLSQIQLYLRYTLIPPLHLRLEDFCNIKHLNQFDQVDNVLSFNRLLWISPEFTTLNLLCLLKLQIAVSAGVSWCCCFVRLLD